MTLLQRHMSMRERVDIAGKAGQLPVRVTIEDVLSPTEVVIGGRRTITAGTHNYLALSLDPRCVEASMEAIRKEGTGTCSSPLEGGAGAQGLLEAEIADFYGMRHCMVFATGYQANLGAVSTLVGEGDNLLIDSDSHASIYDACKQTAAAVTRFKHNDPASLEARLRRSHGRPGENTGRRRGNIFDAR